MTEIQSSWAINDMISYAETEGMGLGVIATKNIVRNQEILRDPVRTFDAQDTEHLKSLEAYHLMFVDRESYSLTKGNSPLHLVLGAISILNHSSDENCIIYWNIEENYQSSHVKLVAKRDIESGEELFIRYHNIEEYDFE